jgi:cytochrome c oxidase accessory protein FixG
MTPIRPHLLGPWRLAFQWGTTLALLLIPFVRFDGESLLRLDVATLTLHACGATFRIQELYLFLLLGLALVLFFLLLTLVLGRAWCGWACPQTSLTDLAEGFARLIGARVAGGRIDAAPWQQLALHLFYGALALLVAANLIWYFISPYDFFPALLGGALPRGAWVTLLAVAACVYFDLALVRRLMCREFCPYGRFQTVLVDPGTLTLRFHPDEAARCIACGACARSCPTGIDIRNGYQIECINCGRCLDACRIVMARRGEPGIIRYTFGLENRGLRALINPRLALVSLLFFALSIALTAAVLNRPEASLALSRNAGAARRLLDDNTQASFFTAYVTNRLQTSQTLSLRAASTKGEPYRLRGPVLGMVLGAGERRRFDFVLLTPVPEGERAQKILFFLDHSSGRPLARAHAFITAVKDSPP